jgi:hypothetical protein
VQHIIGLQLEVEQPSHVNPAGPAPPVVVHGGREISVVIVG